MHTAEVNAQIHTKDTDQSCLIADNENYMKNKKGVTTMDIDLHNTLKFGEIDLGSSESKDLNSKDYKRMKRSSHVSGEWKSDHSE